MNKIIEIIKKKWLRDTFLTILLIAIIFAVYFLINFCAEKIKVDDLDLTTDKIYSISEATKTKLENLNKEVEIILVNLENYQYITDFAGKYANLNSNIKIEVIDNIDSRPDLMNKYELESSDSLLIIQSGEREKLVSLYDLYTYDYTTGEQIDLTEESITNAIIDVTIENKPKVYFLEGHNNYDMAYFQILMGDIESEANEVDTLNILVTGSVPEDCNCLVITTLYDDLTEMEKDKIIEYSNNGGKILLLSDSNIGNKQMPNFEQILDLYGFRISNGILIEQDLSKMVYGEPEFIISEIPQGSAISGNTKMKLSMCVIDAGRIEFKEEETLNSLGVTYETLANTSDKAFHRTNLRQATLDKSADDEDSPNAVIGALVTRKINEEKTSRLIVFSNAVFATNQQINIANAYITYANKLCNNDDVVINSVSYLTERTDTITIRKGSNSVSYTVTQKQNTTVMLIIFGTPLLIIIAGIVVWQVRRRKK